MSRERYKLPGPDYPSTLPKQGTEEHCSLWFSSEIPTWEVEYEKVWKVLWQAQVLLNCGLWNSASPTTPSPAFTLAFTSHYLRQQRLPESMPSDSMCQMLLSLLTGVLDILLEHFLNIHNLTSGLGAEQEKGRAPHAAHWAGGNWDQDGHKEIGSELDGHRYVLINSSSSLVDLLPLALVLMLIFWGRNEDMNKLK